MKIAPPATRGKEIGKLTIFWFLGQFLSPTITFPVLNILSLSHFYAGRGISFTDVNWFPDFSFQQKRKNLLVSNLLYKHAWRIALNRDTTNEDEN